MRTTRDLGGGLPRLEILAEVVEAGEICGAEIRRRTGLISGTVYPSLAALERAGLISGRDELGDPAVLGRPLRRYYHPTPEGRVAALEVSRRLRQLAEYLAREATARSPGP